MKDKTLMLNKIKEYYNFDTHAKFAEFLGIKPNTLSNWYSRNTIDYELIFTKCVGFSGTWILSNGEEGDMLINHSKAPHIDVDNEFTLRTDTRYPSQQIPIYELQAAASLKTVFQGHPNILGYLSIPNMPKSDGALYVTGDSMYPLLKSGDIAIYRQINDLSEGIVFGEMHIISALIDGDVATVIKFVQKSDKGEDWIKLVSQNTYHAPRDIHMSKILAAALVKGSVRINSMM